MLKFNIEDGELKECKFNGTLPELTADIASLVGYVCKQIADDDKLQGEVFVNMVIHGISLALALNQAMPTDKKPAKKKESEVNDFAEEFLKFLYEGDGDEDNN